MKNMNNNYVDRYIPKNTRSESENNFLDRNQNFFNFNNNLLDDRNFINNNNNSHPFQKNINEQRMFQNFEFNQRSHSNFISSVGANFNQDNNFYPSNPENTRNKKVEDKNKNENTFIKYGQLGSQNIPVVMDRRDVVDLKPTDTRFMKYEYQNQNKNQNINQNKKNSNYK
jgi:hypothetical protein